uniref:Uncharacterized protein n=1 Tax=Sparus aurata TaxID=8175 RepID=A0A671VDG1_SPAAU
FLVLSSDLIIVFGNGITEDVVSMLDCTGFLLQETPPRVPGILERGNILDQNRYKPICQTLKNLKSFVTLYDTTNRIPVFSASKYNGSQGGRPQNSWNIEPQLYIKQAGQCDYRNNPQRLDRGHLFPSSYGHTENDRISTFTLTNVVPQVDQFNQGSWSKMEQCIKCVMDDYCINNNGQVEGFLIIGAQPGINTLNNRVNIPSMLWSAFCCYSCSKGWLASAHWGQNIRNGQMQLSTTHFNYFCRSNNCLNPSSLNNCTFHYHMFPA